MDFRQLEYVITIARERTLISASQKLFLSPSALSQHIAKLEDELKTPLFKRTKQGWLPTYAGEIYINMAEDILDRQKQAYLQINDIADNTAGHFTVGVTAGRGAQLFSSIFPRFNALYPHVKVGLFEGTVDQIQDMIFAGNVDIGFLSGVPETPGVCTMHQADEELLLVVPKTHPMAVLADTAPEGDFATVELQDFANDSFLLAGEGTTLRAVEDHLFSLSGFAPEIAFETPSMQTLHLLSKGGYGLSFLPKFYAEGEQDAVFFHTKPSAKWSLAAAYRKDHYITKAEQTMIDLATQYYLKEE